MKNHPFIIPNLYDDRNESPTRRLLERTRLSSLPPIPRRAVCENCKGRLEVDNEFQMSAKICRDCLRNYANIATILDRHAEEKIRRNFKEGKI